jgi:quercetin dioxygenase-like cupin family protein
MNLLYVLQGKVSVRYAGETHLMSEGDSALLDGGAPHSWENVGSRVARVLWVILG